MPSPALALRPENAGLEDNPQINRRLSDALLEGRPAPAAGLEEGKKKGFLTRRKLLLGGASAAVFVGAVITARILPRGASPDFGKQVERRFLQSIYRRPVDGFRVATDGSLRDADRLLDIWERFGREWNAVRDRAVMRQPVPEDLAHQFEALHARFFEDLQAELRRQDPSIVPMNYNQENFYELLLNRLVDRLASCGAAVILLSGYIVPLPGGREPLVAVLPPRIVYRIQNVEEAEIATLQGRARRFQQVTILWHRGRGTRARADVSAAFAAHGTSFVHVRTLEDPLQPLRGPRRLWALGVTEEEVGQRGFWKVVEANEEAVRNLTGNFSPTRFESGIEFSRIKLKQMVPADARERYRERAQQVRLHEGQHLEDREDPVASVWMHRYADGDRTAENLMERRARVNELRGAARIRLLSTLDLVVERQLAPKFEATSEEALQLEKDLLEHIVAAVERDPAAYGVEIRPHPFLTVRDQIAGQLYRIAEPDHPERADRLFDDLQLTIRIPEEGSSYWGWWVAAGGVGTTAAALLGWYVKRRAAVERARKAAKQAPPKTAGMEEEKSERLLTETFNPSDDLSEALTAYRLFRERKLVPFFEERLDSEIGFRFGLPYFNRSHGVREGETALMEAVLNLIEDGQGGVLEIHRVRKQDNLYPILMFRLISQGGATIEDPNPLLERSFEARRGDWSKKVAYGLRNLGFANIADFSDGVILESGGQKWELLKSSPDGRKKEMHFARRGRSDSAEGRTVFTLTFEKIFSVLPSNPWKDLSLGTAAGLEEPMKMSRRSSLLVFSGAICAALFGLLPFQIEAPPVPADRPVPGSVRLPEADGRIEDFGALAELEPELPRISFQQKGEVLVQVVEENPIKIYRVGTNPHYPIYATIFNGEWAQSDALDRTALLVEIEGYRGEIVPIPRARAILQERGRPIYTAHDYPLERIVEFANRAKEFTPAEEQFLRELLRVGLLVKGKAGYRAVVPNAAFMTIPPVRDLFTKQRSAGHEFNHMLYFTSPDFRSECRKVWDSLSAQTQGFIRELAHSQGDYDRRDLDLIVREFAAYARDPHVFEMMIANREYELNEMDQGKRVPHPERIRVLRPFFKKDRKGNYRLNEGIRTDLEGIAERILRMEEPHISAVFGKPFVHSSIVNSIDFYLGPPLGGGLTAMGVETRIELESGNFSKVVNDPREVSPVHREMLLDLLRRLKEVEPLKEKDRLQIIFHPNDITILQRAGEIKGRAVFMGRRSYGTTAVASFRNPHGNFFSPSRADLSNIELSGTAAEVSRVILSDGVKEAGPFLKPFRPADPVKVTIQRTAEGYRVTRVDPKQSGLEEGKFEKLLDLILQKAASGDPAESAAIQKAVSDTRQRFSQLPPEVQLLIKGSRYFKVLVSLLQASIHGSEEPLMVEVMLLLEYLDGILSRAPALLEALGEEGLHFLAMPEQSAWVLRSDLETQVRLLGYDLVSDYLRSGTNRSSESLIREYVAEILPHRGSLEGLLGYFKRQDSIQRPFQEKLRVEAASLSHLPAANIFFVPQKAVLFWRFFQIQWEDALGFQINLRDSRGRSEPIIVIRSELEDLSALITAIHECAHTSQVPEAQELMSREPFVEIMIEVLQIFFEVHFLSNYGSRQDPFAAEVRDLVADAFQHPEIWGGSQAPIPPKPENFSDQARLLLLSSVFNGRPAETKFVFWLIHRYGIQPETFLLVHLAGEVSLLAASIGKERFEALKLFFRQWKAAAYIQSRKPSNMIPLRIVMRAVLEPEDLVPGRSIRLLEFIQELNDSLKLEQQRLTLEMIDPFAGLPRLEAPSILAIIAMDYANGEIDSEGLHDNLQAAIALSKSVLEKIDQASGLEERNSAASAVRVFKGWFENGDPSRLAGNDLLGWLSSATERVTLEIDVNRLAKRLPPAGRIFLQKGAPVPAVLKKWSRVDLSDDLTVAEAKLIEVVGEQAGPTDMALVAPGSVSDARARAAWNRLFQDYRLPGIVMTDEALASLEMLAERDPAYLAAFLAATRKAGGLIAILSIEVDEQTPGQRRLFLYA